MTTATQRSAPIVPANGQGWPALAAHVDAQVRDFMAKNKLPGMTVAVTKDGRLILSKGYGYANTSTRTTMQPHHRSRIGSVTKAVITGPAAFKVMKDKKVDPATKALYGSNGVFGMEYDADFTIGIRRYTPIVDVAISAEDRVYTWYQNGTYSIGSSSNLASRSAPKAFKLPPGKKPVDIRAIGITQNIPVVCFVWYDDGSFSVGTPEALGSVQVGSKNSVKLPSRKFMRNIVGIDFAKSSNNVYAWFEDGTVSSGVPNDLAKHFAPKPFECPPGTTPYQIRGVGIAKNDHVYAWFSNGKASSGMSTRLHRHRTPYDYAIPSGVGTPNWSDWYSEITLQNLLDHEAGFTGSGDTDGAMALFKVTKDKLTYEHVHRHLLRTRKLRYEPGTTGGYSRSGRYSNHGFGLWTLIIEKLSGKPYWPYVCDEYLRPLGLQNDVLPERQIPDARDAWNHEYGKQENPVPSAFEQHGLGLAAGGFRSSAQNLARLTTNMKGKYSDSELERMGWAKGTGGILGPQWQDRRGHRLRSYVSTGLQVSLWRGYGPRARCADHEHPDEGGRRG
jgi:CubicO group peptidase (beta-lactamase class C family)